MALTDMSGFNMGTQPPPGQYQSPYAGRTTDPSAPPIMPQWNSIYDPNTMSLQNQMQGMLAGTSYDTQPLGQIKQNAESTSPSPWATLEQNLNSQKTAQNESQAAGQAAGSVAQGESNLAMSGGLSSGARERVQDSGAAAGIGAQQSAANTGNTNAANIGISDAQNKQQQLMALPGMETQAYQASLEPIQMMGQAGAQDIAHQMANSQSLNQFNMGAYGNQAAMYGANQTANATQNAADNSGGLFGGGGFLGLGSWLCSERNRLKPLTEAEKNYLSRLLKHARKADRAFTKWYLKYGSRLVDLITLQDPKWATETNPKFIDTVIDLLRRGDDWAAFQYYRKHVYALCNKYWPTCAHDVIASHPERKEWAA